MEWNNIVTVPWFYNKTKCPHLFCFQEKIDTPLYIISKPGENSKTDFSFHHHPRRSHFFFLMVLAFPLVLWPMWFSWGDVTDFFLFRNFFSSHFLCDDSCICSCVVTDLIFLWWCCWLFFFSGISLAVVSFAMILAFALVLWRIWFSCGDVADFFSFQDFPQWSLFFFLMSLAFYLVFCFLFVVGTDFSSSGPSVMSASIAESVFHFQLMMLFFN